MEFEELLVNGKIVKEAVRIDDDLNPDNDPGDEDKEMLYDTVDYSNLFENTIEIIKDDNNE